MPFGLYGKLVTQPGKRDAVVDVLLRDVDALKEAGCLAYIVNRAVDDATAVWVTEIWESPEAHQASLELPSVKSAIAEAMPLLTGEFEQIKLDVVGGLGMPE